MNIAIDEPEAYTRVSTRPVRLRKRLAEMNPGEEGIIEYCCGEKCCGNHDSHRLVDYPELSERMQIMGICPGRRIRIVRRGSPMVVRVLDTHLGVSSELARDVFVLCE